MSFTEPFVGATDGIGIVGDEVFRVGDEVVDGAAVIAKVGRRDVGCCVGRVVGLGVTRYTEED